ncbi:DUF169 domain-containing protein [Methanobrevibacter sp. TMH8]|uniref:DUF169 domain-containing protein n=1 Tax=Methanobrevibacter sp. TMH8 TaxID=2848611 RepID=UPI001CCAD7E0|nr:DUF169 domain-containing protein [Methanobrevibacter sp. TMH8]MBZ9571123.1 DUF169 domain-containing protein [Methanobrevibacter sp. TMH8]
MIDMEKIGKKFKTSLKLDTFPLAIYESRNIPENAVPLCSVDHCVAKSIFLTSTNENENPVYINNKTLRGCCPGSMTYLGFAKPAKFIKYFVSTGKESVRGGAAEYLKASPEDVEKFLKSIGEIKKIENNLVIQKCEDMKNINDIDNIADIDNIGTNNTDTKDINIKSILVFGNSEQIRNLSNLIYFNNENTFTGISTPFGPSCASFITYPNGMAENTPKETVFMGPVDPTGNIWFPSDYLSMGIPIEIAMKLYENIDSSFLSKRPEVAFPKR